MTPKVGKTIDGWCTRCKLVLTHTIEAMDGGKITRVHCNTCSGQHAHRAAAPKTRAASGGAAGGRKTNGAAKPPPKRSEYESLLRGRTKDASRPYSSSTRFAVGDLVSHSTFGLGVVTAERDSVKIDIVFADGPKVLLQGR